jgi:hypothetical protein
LSSDVIWPGRFFLPASGLCASSTSACRASIVARNSSTSFTWRTLPPPQGPT